MNGQDGKPDSAGATGQLLPGKVAVITGVAGGLGSALAEAFLRAGATVVGCDVVVPGGSGPGPVPGGAGPGGDRPGEGRPGEGGPDAGADGRGAAEFIVADVSREAEVERLIETVVARHARLDVFVNNAAVQIERELADTTEADLDRILAVNLKGVFFGTKHAVRAMRGSGGGSIVNISSVLGLVGDGMLAAYCAAKGGVLGLTRAAAVQYAGAGIRCNALCPGDIETPLLTAYLAQSPDPVAARAQIERQYPVRRIAQAEEVARTAIFLASDQSAFVNGQTLVVDGGMLASCYRG